MSCHCKSERPQAKCHDALAEVYRPLQPGSLAYPLPAHVNRNQSSFYAGRLSLETGYSIDSSSYPRWTISQARVFPPMLLVPVLRGLVHDPELRVVVDAFRGIAHWPQDALPTPPQRDAAEQQLIRIASTKTIEDLLKLREAFVELLRFGDAAQLEAGLNDLVLTLRTAFPQATIDVLRLHPRVLFDPLMIRVLALMPLMEIPQLSRLLERPVSDAYGQSLFYPEAYFELMANLCFPRTFGFGIRFGPEAYVIVDYGQDITLNATEASERRARDIGATLFGNSGSTMRARSFPAMRIEDRHFLRVWLTRRLNFLFSHLCNLYSLHAAPDGTIDTAGLWKDLLTLKDIVSLAQILATSSDPAVIRLTFFNFMDRFGQLGGRPHRKLHKLLCEDFVAKLAASIDEDLLDLAPVVRSYLLDSWRDFCDGVWAGVHDEDAREARAINLAPPGAPPHVLGGTDFVSQMSRVLRNTTHGYRLDHRAFELYLVRHSGKLPDSVRELGIAFWLCLLACPQNFWPDPQRFTGMERIIHSPTPLREVAAPASPPA